MRSRGAASCIGALIAALAMVATTIGPMPEGARATHPTRFVTGWIPNWSAGVVTDGLRVFNAGQGYENMFAETSPFGFSATSATTIATSGAESTLTTAVQTLRNRGIQVVPSITDGTGKLTMAAILADPATRTQHVNAIVALVMSRGYEGIDLDYEGFAFSDGRASWPTTRPVWAAFVNELATALHAQGKLLSVTVPPIWAGGAQGYTVYAWPEIIASVDRLRLMVYDWSVSRPGPISPMVWVNDVISYVQGVAGPMIGKVQIGVPTYGRSWATVISGTCPVNADLTTRAVQMENAGALAAGKGATPARDVSGEMKFTYDESFTGTRTAALPAPEYVIPVGRANTVAPADGSALAAALRLSPVTGTVTCTVRRTVYYPDSDSVVQRARAAIDAGTAGIAIWALGYETADLWPKLAALS